MSSTRKFAKAGIFAVTILVATSFGAARIFAVGTDSPPPPSDQKKEKKKEGSNAGNAIKQALR